MSLQSFSCIEKIKSTGATYMAASGLGGDNHIVIIIFPAPITVYNVHPTLYIQAGKVGSCKNPQKRLADENAKKAFAFYVKINNLDIDSLRTGPPVSSP